MFINHPVSVFQGIQPENVFFVSNDQHVQLGYGYVVQFFQNEMYPERPQHLYVQMEAQQSARSLLFGALLARAEQLRSMNPQVPTRLYTQLTAKDQELMRYYEKLGFKNDDAEDMYRFLPIPGRAAAPMGMQYASVPLETLEQQDMFLNRLNAYRIQPVNRDYLTLWRNQPHFLALAFFRQGVPVCECVFTGAGDHATLLEVHTLPQYRRQGLAYQLLGAACVHLREMGVQTIYTHVFRRNQAQMALMRKLNGEFVRTVNFLPGIDL